MPGLTEDHVNVPPQHKDDHHQQHEEPGEDETEANPSARTEMPSAPTALWPSTDAGIVPSRAQGLHTPHPHSCGNTTLPTSSSLCCLESPEHDRALPWSFDSRKASQDFARQHSPAELQDPRTHCQPSLSRGKRAPLQCLSLPSTAFDLQFTTCTGSRHGAGR